MNPCGGCSRFTFVYWPTITPLSLIAVGIVCTAPGKSTFVNFPPLKRKPCWFPAELVAYAPTMELYLLMPVAFVITAPGYTRASQPVDVRTSPLLFELPLGR